MMKETGASSGKLKKEIPSEAQREDYTMHNGQENETQNARVEKGQKVRRGPRKKKF